MNAHPEQTAGFAARASGARSALLTLGFVTASALLLLRQIGYSFEQGDQLQYLLLPYRELFADFLPGDWFTWQTAHYHQTFAWIIRGIHAALGETGFARGVFAVHTLCLAAFAYALLTLARALGLGLFEASWTVLTFACVRQVGLAGAVVNHGGLVPADLALAPFLLACAACVEARTIVLGVYLGVAGFLHANYAVLGPVLLMPIALYNAVRGPDRARALRRLALGVGLFVLIASPTLWLVIGSFLTQDRAPQAVALTLFVRSPHHYDLRAMRLDQFYYTALLALTALPYALGQVGPAARRRVWLQLTAAMVLLIAVGVVGSGWHVVSLARLFTWRMSIPLFALWQLAAARALREYARTRAWLSLTWALGLWLLATCFAQTDQLESSPWNDPTLVRVAALGGALVLIATAAALLPAARLGVLRTAVVGATGLALGLGASVTYSRYWLGEHYVAPRGLHFLDAPVTLSTPARAIYAQIRAHTPSDARFLVPPGQSLFRLQARRSIFVDWKCAPMKGDEALEWQRRMLAAMGLNHFPAQGYELPRAADRAYATQPLSALAALARKEGLTHVLVRKDGRTPPPSLRRTLEGNGYVVYALVP